MNNFKVGDWVRLSTGHAKQRVLMVHDDGYLRLTYPHRTDLGTKLHHSNNVVMFDTKEKEEEMAALYEFTVDSEVKYGSKLAVDSSGKFVMEIKGGGVVAVDPSSVSEVLPHTVSVVFSRSDNTKEYHYLAKQGLYEAGEFYLDRGFQVIKVVRLNTKSREATTRLETVAHLIAESHNYG